MSILVAMTNHYPRSCLGPSVRWVRGDYLRQSGELRWGPRMASLTVLYSHAACIPSWTLRVYCCCLPQSKRFFANPRKLVRLLQHQRWTGRTPLHTFQYNLPGAPGGGFMPGRSIVYLPFLSRTDESEPPSTSYQSVRFLFESREL